MEKRPLITLKKKPTKPAASKNKHRKERTNKPDAPRPKSHAKAPRTSTSTVTSGESRQRARKPKPRSVEVVRQELKTDSLAFALLGAADAVAQVKGGTALPEALTHVFANPSITPQARGAIQDIAYRAMRQLGMAEALLNQLVTKAPESMVLHSLLCCALSLLLDSEAAVEGKGYEAFTIVDQAVTAAAADSELVYAKGMVNAVLRRFLREKDVLMAEAQKSEVALWNYPQWWIDEVRAAYPRNWQAILEAGNAPPPLTLRVNVQKTTVNDYLQRLAENGMAAMQIGPVAVRLAQPVPVSQIPGFDEGLVSVQDAAAQLAAPLLDVHDGMRVLDACAAPGGKTGHLLESSRIDLLALDVDGTRLARINENLQRLELSASVKTGDASSRDWWDGQPFDRILVDVPCTASGIVRRHPDIRWLRRKGDTRRLATLSAHILDNLWQMLRPDGKLLFVTCSMWPQESEGQAAAFAVRQGAHRVDAPGQLHPVAKEDADHDGLFYALFQKMVV